MSQTELPGKHYTILPMVSTKTSWNSKFFFWWNSICTTAFQHRFSINVWTGLINRQIIDPFVSILLKMIIFLFCKMEPRRILIRLVRQHLDIVNLLYGLLGYPTWPFMIIDLNDLRNRFETATAKIRQQYRLLNYTNLWRRRARLCA